MRTRSGVSGSSLATMMAETAATTASTTTKAIARRCLIICAVRSGLRLLLRPYALGKGSVLRGSDGA